MKDNKKSLEKNVFSYGHGKPQITYTNNPLDNQNRDVFNFYFTVFAPAPNYKAHLLSQKWNNIVFNYSSEKVDLFINGNLETSFHFNKENPLPTYNEQDSITVGEKKGLHGAICNIVYNKNNLLNNQIVNDYNILMLQNPPIPQI